MTDHRTEAEWWLGYAKDREAENLPANEVHSAALISIGHALLANLPPTYTATIDERCPWWTDGNSWALWSGSPAKRRCVLYANHQGDHRDPPTQPPEEDVSA